MLSVDGLTKRFGGLVAVDGVSVTVDDGEIAGLIGPNGAGKTTLFNLVTGLYRADSGSVTWQGDAIHRLPPHRIAARGIARTFQNIRLFDRLTALENVMIARHSRTKSSLASALFRTRAYRSEEAETRAKAMEALAFVGLDDAAMTPAGDLPYGAQRRLEIARALAAEPALLLLDEPAAGMNESESRALVQLVKNIRDERDISILLIEHDMHVVMSLCDRVTVLNFGRLLASGTPSQIQADARVIEAYLGSEAAHAAR